MADLSKQEDLERIMETTIKHFGQLDVLVNNAAVSLGKKIEDLKAVEAFDYTIKVNLRAPYVLTHLAVPHLSKTKGCAVNVSSTHSSRSVRSEISFSLIPLIQKLITKSYPLMALTRLRRVD